jgi:hypothetical protein
LSKTLANFAQLAADHGDICSVMRGVSPNVFFLLLGVMAGQDDKRSLRFGMWADGTPNFLFLE